MKTNASKESLVKALENVNKAQGYKLTFNRCPESQGRFQHFTIRSEKSKIHGASISHSGRNTTSASWEAHGNFFEELLKLDPTCKIISAKSTIDINGGNWQDFNIGSLYQPMYASENAYQED